MEVVFTFQVEKEKQDDFIDFVRTGTKAWWEAHGCLAYTLWKVDGEEWIPTDNPEDRGWPGLMWKPWKKLCLQMKRIPSVRSSCESLGLL